MLQASEYDRAAVSCERSWTWVRQNWFFTDYMVRSLPLLVEAELGPRWNRRQAS
jgi:hypothetical protein